MTQIRTSQGVLRGPPRKEWTLSGSILRLRESLPPRVIAFAPKKVTIPGFRKALKEEDRFAIAKEVLEHLKLCRWEFSKP